MPQKLLELRIELLLKIFDRFLALFDHKVLLLKLVINIDLLLCQQPVEVGCLLNLLIMSLPVLLFKLSDGLVQLSNLLLKLLQEHGNSLYSVNILLNFPQGILTCIFDLSVALDHESFPLVLLLRLSDT